MADPIPSKPSSPPKAGTPSADASDSLARTVFLITVLGAGAFVAAVLIFVL